MTKFRAPIALLLLYWCSRLWHLTTLPGFLDEINYIGRAQQINAGNWSVMLFDGTVLHPRLLALLMPLAQTMDTSLYFARWFNVAFDALGFICLYVTAQKAFSQRAAVAASLFYLISPFVFFYDRMALADGPLMTFYALTFWLSLRVADGSGRWRSALALGLVLAAACFTKLSGVIFVAVPVFAVLSARDWRGAVRPWPRWLLVYTVPLATFAPMLLAGSANYQIESKSVSTLGPDELLRQIMANFGSLVEALTAYSPGLLIVLIALAPLLALRLRRKSLLWIAGALWPAIFFILVGRIVLIRYILMSAIPIAVLAGWCCAQLNLMVQRWIPRLGSAPVALALLAGAIPALQFDYLIATDPPAAPWPSIERFQYISDWPAGYGMDDAVATLRRLAGDSPDGIHVMRNGDSPLLERLDVYLWRDSRINVVVGDFAHRNPRPTLTRLAKERPTYIILDPPREPLVFAASYPRAVKVAEFPKPGGESAIVIYEWPP